MNRKKNVFFFVIEFSDISVSFIFVNGFWFYDVVMFIDGYSDIYIIFWWEILKGMDFVLDIL